MRRFIEEPCHHEIGYLPGVHTALTIASWALIVFGVVTIAVGLVERWRAT